MNRCVKDSFGYCSSGTAFKFTESKITVFDYEGRPETIKQDVPSCDLDPKTCQHYHTLSQSLENLILPA